MYDTAALSAQARDKKPSGRALELAIASEEVEFLHDAKERLCDGWKRANEDLHTLRLMAKEISRHHDEMNSLYQRLNTCQAGERHGRYLPNQAAEIEIETCLDDALSQGLSLVRLYLAHHDQLVGRSENAEAA